MSENTGERFCDTLNFVVHFLHEQGFHKAHSALLQEFNTRLQNSASPAAAEGFVFASRQSVSACSAPPSTFEYGERAAEALSPPRSKSAEAGSRWEGFPGPPTVQKAASTAGAVELAATHGARSSAPTSAAASPPAAASARAARRRLSRPSGQRHRPWDGEADDYESMEDPGYSRRDVPSQARFVEMELDLCSEEGSERAYFMHQPGDLNYDDIESEVSASDPEGITAASSVQSGQYGAFGDAHDETWDLGPTDIKFAEPVSTPSRSPEKQEPEERRPVLSRVESLSSSFKDFEMERGFNADGETEGQISSKVSESEYVADPEVIDFPVTVVNHEDVELFRQRRPSPTSSMDVAGGSLAPSVAPLEPQGADGMDSKGRAHRKDASKATSLLKGLAMGRGGEVRANGMGGAAAGGRGSGAGVGAGSSGGGAGPSSGGVSGAAGGGFSFPVTPPSDEPEQRLFTSWPSVRSSCTSEPVAMLDDDGALPAEYADDDYSKYRLSSRSTSLAAHDFPSERKTGEGDASGAPPSPDGASAGQQSAEARSVDVADVALDWAFKLPANELGSGAREPSLEFSAHSTSDAGSEGVETPTAASTGPAGPLTTSPLAVVAQTPASSVPAGTTASVAPSGTPASDAAGALPDSAAAGAEAEGEAAADAEDEPSVAADAEVAEDALESQHDTVTLAGELETLLDEAVPIVLQPPLPRGEAAAVAEPPADSQEVLSPTGQEGLQEDEATGSERIADGPQVVAHRITFEVDDHSDTDRSFLSYGGAGVSYGGASDVAAAPGGRHAAPDQPHSRRQVPLAPAPGFGVRHDPDGDAATFSEPASYDGNEADVDEPLDEQASGLDEQLSGLLDEHEPDDELGSGRRGGDRGDPEAAAAWGEEGRLQANNAKETTVARPDSALMPRYHVDEHGNVMYEYEHDYIEKKYEVFDLRIIHRRHRTGFEETKDFPIRLNDLIAGRYQVMDFLGSAAFSRAVQALDIKTGQLVCLKIIKNNKDYFDQSLDEIKLLKYVNTMDPNDEFAIVRLYDFFYYKEHLFLVCELLRANLYEFQKYNKESGDELYFTNARIQRIARQALRSLAFLHSLGLIHSDLKPENILIKSYSRCEVKVIDLGSSCFITDQLSSYVQSRSYRAPEVILGLPYDYKVDVWSLGCILAELSSGYVLFQNDSLSTLLARLEGILGPIPEWMLHKGRYAHRFYTRSGMLYERSSSTQRYELLLPKRTSLRHRMPDADEGLLEFVAYLLTVDPRKRPTAAEALRHPWLLHEYPSLDA